MIPLTISTISKFNKSMSYRLMDNEMSLFIQLMDNRFSNLINTDTDTTADSKLKLYNNYVMPDYPKGKYSGRHKTHQIKVLKLKGLSKHVAYIPFTLGYCLRMYTYLRRNESVLERFYEYKKGIMSEYVVGGVIPVCKTFDVWLDKPKKKKRKWK